MLGLQYQDVPLDQDRTQFLSALRGGAAALSARILARCAVSHKQSGSGPRFRLVPHVIDLTRFSESLWRSAVEVIRGRERDCRQEIHCAFECG
jgi:hypothetical protein